jgi:hypothetical protein
MAKPEPEFTPEEKKYLKESVIPNLEDLFVLPGLPEDEGTLIFNLTAKLKELCDA